MNNKRGQGLSTNAIVLIVLGVIVLAVLILGFAVGWSKVLPFLSSDNIDDIKTSCQIACSTDGEFDFCSVKRELKADGVNLKDVTCNYLAQRQSAHGIVDGGVEVCGSISCNAIVSSAVTEQGAMTDCPASSDGTDVVQYIVGDTLKSYSCSAQNS